MKEPYNYRTVLDINFGVVHETTVVIRNHTKLSAHILMCLYVHKHTQVET